jgi:hypothetical protein
MVPECWQFMTNGDFWNKKSAKMRFMGMRGSYYIASFFEQYIARSTFSKLKILIFNRQDNDLNRISSNLSKKSFHGLLLVRPFGRNSVSLKKNGKIWRKFNQKLVSLLCGVKFKISKKKIIYRSTVYNYSKFWVPLAALRAQILKKLTENQNYIIFLRFFHKF